MLPVLAAAAVQLGSAALSKGGNQAPAGPQYLDGNEGPLANKADVDFSGWTVATSGARADGAKISKTSSDALGVPSGVASGIAGGLAVVPPVVWVAGAVVLVALLWPRSKK